MDLLVLAVRIFSQFCANLRIFNNEIVIYGNPKFLPQSYHKTVWLLNKISFRYFKSSFKIVISIFNFINFQLQCRYAQLLVHYLIERQWFCCCCLFLILFCFCGTHGIFLGGLEKALTLQREGLGYRPGPIICW